MSDPGRGRGSGASPGETLPPGIDPLIVCVDCGGRAHLLSRWPPDAPPEPGDVVSYSCEDCYERLDVVVPDEDEV